MLSKMGRSRARYLKAMMNRLEGEPRTMSWQKQLRWWDMQDILRHGYQSDRDYLKRAGVVWHNLHTLRMKND